MSLDIEGIPLHALWENVDGKGALLKAFQQTQHELQEPPLPKVCFGSSMKYLSEAGIASSCNRNYTFDARW